MNCVDIMIQFIKELGYGVKYVVPFKYAFFCYC